MRVEVTSQHIRDGIPSQPYRCPVALAVRAAMRMAGNPGDGRVAANGCHIRIDGVRHETPGIVTEFMNRFDDSKSPARPAAFAFDLPPPLGSSETPL